MASMKNWFKDNWFQFFLAVAALVSAGSIFYHYVIYLSEDQRRLKQVRIEDSHFVCQNSTSGLLDCQFLPELPELPKLLPSLE